MESPSGMIFTGAACAGVWPRTTRPETASAAAAAARKRGRENTRELLFCMKTLENDHAHGAPGRQVSTSGPSRATVEGKRFDTSRRRLADGLARPGSEQ